MSCLERVKLYLNNIHSHSELNIFLEIFEQEALEKASQIDAKIQNGSAGKLAGLICSIKDNICYQGHKVSASSKMLEGFESLFSATAIKKLLNEDAIIIGRTNCDEFAMGSSNENSAFGVVKNPLNPEYVPGGSSGGAAAAVAANMCDISLGSDTGGSIRQPAAFCGVIGLRPTYSRISRHGLIAFASSFDIIGIIGNSIKDVALTLEVISGNDDFDATVSNRPVPEYSKNLNLDIKPKIAIIKQTIEGEGISPEVTRRFKDIIADLKSQGYTVDEISFPLLDAMVPVYYVLATAEASSNLSRFTGVGYGHRTSEAGNFDEMISKSRSEGFGKEVQRRIMLGTFVLSEGFYDAYYTKAQKVRQLILQETNSIFSKYDIMLSPTSPSSAFKIGGKSNDPIAMYFEDIFAIHSAAAGIPAISLPLGKSENSMPFGFQLMGKAFSEEDLFTFSEIMMEKYSIS